MLVSARPFAAVSVSTISLAAGVIIIVSSSAGAVGAGSVTTSASTQIQPHLTLFTNALSAVCVLYGEVGAVADLRQERTMEVLVAAATELLVAGRPVDGGLDGTHDLVVVQYEFAHCRQVSDGVWDCGEVLQFARQNRTGAHENVR